MTLPDKSDRPRAFDRSPARYQWRAGRISTTVRVAGNEIKQNPFIRTALFVVHGIGDQRDTETAARMRWGVEDSLPLIDPGNWGPPKADNGGSRNEWILPAPYIHEAHWANYDDLTVFEDDIGADLTVLTNRQRAFFTGLWRARTKGWLRSWGWLVTQGFKLVCRGTLWKRPFYLVLTLLVGAVMFIAGLSKRSRKFIVTYVNDARLYFEPKGDLEHEIVQLIDRRVARAFLATLGLDMEFNEIEDYNGVIINGEAHAFDHVIWVAHSLGTVISFNVIGDILRRCLEVRKQHAKETGADYRDDCPRASRVEKALTKFVTFGSPLDKILFLYAYDSGKRRMGDEERTNAVLRPWPEEYLSDGDLDLRCKAGGSCWWMNFFYGSDPISGPLDSIEEFLGVGGNRRLIENQSTLRLRLPLASHNRYWKDTGVVTRILSEAYAGYTREVLYSLFRRSGDGAEEGHFVRAWPPWVHGWLSSMGLFWITLLAIGLTVTAIINREHILPWFQNLL